LSLASQAKSLGNKFIPKEGKDVAGPDAPLLGAQSTGTSSMGVLEVRRGKRRGAKKKKKRRPERQPKKSMKIKERRRQKKGHSQDDAEHF
jgi:hypothetical protein